MTHSSIQEQSAEILGANVKGPGCQAPVLGAWYGY